MTKASTEAEKMDGVSAAKRRKTKSPAAEPPSWNEAAVAAAFASAKAAGPAAPMTGASAEEAICLDLDEEDPLTFLLKAGVPRALAQEAIRVHGTDLDAAQLFIFQQRAGGGAQAGPSGGAASGPAAKPAAAKPGQAKLSAAEIQAAQDAYDEAEFQRQMAAAQAESTAAAEAEAAQLHAAFEASARAAPLSTFESSAFLAAARETGASEAELAACTEPLAELLLHEREAKRFYGAPSSPFFARLGVAFVGIAAEARAGWLAAKVVAVSDGPGGMLAMPSGGGGSLPAVFSTCAAGATIISDPEVVVLDDD